MRGSLAALALVATVGAITALVLDGCSGDDSGGTPTGGAAGASSHGGGGQSAEGGAGGSGGTASGGAASSEGGGGSGAGGGISSLPQAVVDAGYLTHTLDSTFTAKTVDVANTKKPGFQWYPWNLFGTTTELDRIVLEGDGAVTLAGSKTGPNGELISGSRTGGTTFVGTAFGGGAYFEAVFSFDPADVLAHDYKGYPAWWGIPVDHILQSPGTWWNGDETTHFDNHVEPDFFEYGAKGQPPEVFGGTLHNWYGVESTTCTDKTFCDWHTPTSVNRRSAPVGTDFKQDHAVGFLWIPATASTDGSASFYFDRVAVGETLTWKKWKDAQARPTAADQADTPQPSWALSWLDEGHYLLVLGTGEGEPMKVKRVDVWQKSAAANLVR